MKESVKGKALTQTTVYILMAVYHPNHGYGIMKYVEEKTNGRIKLGAGTLYGALNSLSKKGWIEMIHEGEKRKTYQITAEGKQILWEEYRKLSDMINTIEQIVGKDFWE